MGPCESSWKVLPKTVLEPTGRWADAQETAEQWWGEGILNSSSFELFSTHWFHLAGLGQHPGLGQAFLMRVWIVLCTGYVWHDQTFQRRGYQEEKSRKAEVTRAGGRKEKSKARWGGGCKVRRLTLTKGGFHFWRVGLSLQVNGCPGWVTLRWEWPELVQSSGCAVTRPKCGWKTRNLKNNISGTIGSKLDQDTWEEIILKNK